MLNPKDRVPKGEEMSCTCILQARSRERSPKVWTSHEILRTGPAQPRTARSQSWQVPDSFLVPGGRAVPAKRTGPGVRASFLPSLRRGPGSPYLARHPGPSLRSQLPARSGAPTPPPATRRATLSVGDGRGRRGKRRGRGLQRRGGSGHAPHPRRGGPASARRPLASAARGAQARTTLPRRRCGAAYSSPQRATLRSCQKGLGAGTHLVASSGCACTRVRIHPSVQPSIYPFLHPTFTECILSLCQVRMLG